MLPRALSHCALVAHDGGGCTGHRVKPAPGHRLKTGCHVWQPSSTLGETPVASLPALPGGFVCLRVSCTALLVCLLPPQAKPCARTPPLAPVCLSLHPLSAPPPQD